MRAAKEDASVAHCSGARPRTFLGELLKSLSRGERCGGARTACWRAAQQRFVLKYDAFVPRAAQNTKAETELAFVRH